MMFTKKIATDAAAAARARAERAEADAGAKLAAAGGEAKLTVLAHLRRSFHGLGHKFGLWPKHEDAAHEHDAAARGPKGADGKAAVPEKPAR